MNFKCFFFGHSWYVLSDTSSSDPDQYKYLHLTVNKEDIHTQKTIHLFCLECNKLHTSIINLIKENGGDEI